MDDASALRIPRDERWPACALSGEDFQTEWDDELGGWVYVGAVKLQGERAAQYGLPDGAIVKVSSLRRVLSPCRASSCARLPRRSVPCPPGVTTVGATDCAAIAVSESACACGRVSVRACGRVGVRNLAL